MSSGLQMPSFADMPPEMQAQILAMLQQPGAGSPEVPDATFRGYQPPTPPTGAPTPVNLAGYGVPAQGAGPAASGPQAPLLSGVLGGAPSMAAGQMGAPAMPGPASQMPVPQQADAPAPGPAQMPSLAGAMPPQMPPGGRPAGISPTVVPVTHLGPTAPSGTDDSEDAPNANLPMVRATPLPPTRPPGFGSSATASPTETGAIPTGAPAMTGPANAASKPSGPQVGTPQAEDGGFDLGRMIKRAGDSGLGDYMLALGAGIAGGKTWGEGLSAGFGNASRVGATQAATQLAQAKTQAEQAKLGGNVALLRRAYPNLSDAELAGMASNSSIVTDALKRIAPSETYKTDTDTEGNVWQTNTQNGQRSLLKAGSSENWAQASLPGGGTMLYSKTDPTKTQVLVPGQPVRPATAQERADYGIPATQPTKMTPEGPVAIGGGGVTVNMPPTEQARDKKIGDAIGTDISDYIGAARPAREKLAALNVLSDAWKAGGDRITTGPAAERVLGLKQFARGSLGMNIGDDIAPSELISKIGTQLATADAKSLTARPTQFDFATYLKNNPGLTLTPEGNAALIDIKRQQAQHELDLSALARKKENWDNFDDVVAQYDRTHPIVSSLTGKPLDANSVQFPGAGGQPRQDVTGAAIPGGAVQALQQNPGLAAQFEAKYGRGSASRYLGGR